ncbi:hypothetical protein PS880_06277 [Pseudomonas fluorescens]|uniref:Uncharacterized protein n=1 Tax=Pseudomonas fluorescens TaxID=294 RepID=A0A5E7QI77_PSEFL|nr:hypothetical protein PS880_06277 [Pseudomonas fluorescens]
MIVRAVLNITHSIKEHSSVQRIARFALVQPSIHAAA